MSDLSDGELLGAYGADGDEGAFVTLMNRHGGTALKCALPVAGDWATAEDVAQATFVTLARKAPSLNLKRSLAGWLHHVAVCLARNERRNRLCRMVHENAASLVAPHDGEAHGISSTTAAVLMEEVAALPEVYRAALVMHYFEGRSYAETAKALGCRGSALSMRLTRAREKLKIRLIKRGVAPGSAVPAETASAAEYGSAEPLTTHASLWRLMRAATCRVVSPGE